jgi:hypothetical protein
MLHEQIYTPLLLVRLKNTKARAFSQHLSHLFCRRSGPWQSLISRRRGRFATACPELHPGNAKHSIEWWTLPAVGNSRCPVSVQGSLIIVLYQTSHINHPRFSLTLGSVRCTVQWSSAASHQLARAETRLRKVVLKNSPLSRYHFLTLSVIGLGLGGVVRLRFHLEWLNVFVHGVRMVVMRFLY